MLLSDDRYRWFGITALSSSALLCYTLTACFALVYHQSVYGLSFHGAKIDKFAWLNGHDDDHDNATADNHTNRLRGSQIHCH